MENIVLQKRWVQGGNVVVDDLRGTMIAGEAGAHTFQISGVDSAQETVAITGTITGRFLTATNVTVPLTGSVSDGVASLTLTEDCYVVPGRFVLSVFATNGSTTQCIYCAVGNVFRTQSDIIEYPSASIPDIEQIIADAQEAVTEINAEVTAAQAAVAAAQTAVDGIEAQRQTMIASIASVAGQGTDTTLSQSGVAADAKATGDEVSALKSAVEELTIIKKKIVYTSGGYYWTNVGIGSTVNLTKQSDANWESAIIDCNAGDRFQINGYGASARAWAFIDADNKLLSISDAGLINGTIVAPTNASKIVLNNKLSENTSESYSLVGQYNYVTPEMFGAVGDGTTDDTAAVSKAFNSGYPVYMLNKTYLTQDILVSGKTNISIIGHGTQFKFKDQTNNKKWITFLGCDGISIEGITFDGNRDNQTIVRTSDGYAGYEVSENCPIILIQNTDNVNISNCSFNNCQGDGVQIDHIYADQSATASTISHKVFIHDCSFDTCGRYGVTVVHAENVIVSDNTFSNMSAFSTGVAGGVDIEPNPVSGFACRHIVISGNTLSSCMFGIAVGSGSASVLDDVLVTGNNIMGGTYGIHLSTETDGKCMISNNFIKGSKFGVFGDKCYYTTIENNMFHTIVLSESDTYGAGIGIAITDSLVHSIISGNTFDSCLGVYTLVVNNANLSTIRNNEFNDTVESGFHILISTSFTNGRINQNTFGGSKYPINIATCDTANISGNVSARPTGGILNINTKNDVTALNLNRNEWVTSTQ